MERGAFPANFALWSFEMLPNARVPSVVTLEGMDTEVKPVTKNAWAPIEVTPEGIDTEVNEVAERKALAPIEVTLEGIDTEVNEPAEEKAPLPIEVTPSGMMADPPQELCCVTTLETILKVPEMLQGMYPSSTALDGDMGPMLENKRTEQTVISNFLSFICMPQPSRVLVLT